jgi:hypothetical protein
MVIGVTTEGQMYFNVGGASPDLLTIDGLLKYAERRMKVIWGQRESAAQATESDVESNKENKE